MMEQDSLLLIVAVVAVVIAIVGVGVTYNSIGIFNNFLTGYVTESGTVKLNITTIASINITSADNVAGSKTLNWGAGTFTPGMEYALLASNGTVVGGTWTAVDKGFIVENIGNQNVSLSISATPASTFLGGTSPLFQYNVTNSQTGSCNFSTTGIENVYKDFSSTATAVCQKFYFDAAKDEIRIDVFMKVPIDSKTGALTNTVVLTYAAV